MSRHGISIEQQILLNKSYKKANCAEERLKPEIRLFEGLTENQKVIVQRYLDMMNRKGVSEMDTLDFYTNAAIAAQRLRAINKGENYNMPAIHKKTRYIPDPSRKA